MPFKVFKIKRAAATYVRYLLREENDARVSAENNTEWFGRALPRFKLRAGDPIDPKALVNLMEGRHPDGTPALQVQRWKSRKPQKVLELHFSTSKDFDCLFAVASEAERKVLLNIFRDAVRAELAHMESRFLARRGHGGSRTEPGKLAFACVYHVESNEGDPKVHAHVVLMPVCVGQDGKTLAVPTPLFFNAQDLGTARLHLNVSHSVATVFGAKVARSGRGFRLGVPPSLARAWSTRAVQIEEEVRRSGDGSIRGRERAAKVTRREKQRRAPAERDAAWAATAAEHRFSFAAVVDPERAARQRHSDRAQAHRADEAVRAAADALSHWPERCFTKDDHDWRGGAPDERALGRGLFTADELTAEAAFRLIGKGVSLAHLEAAVERACSRPLEHGLAPVAAMCRRWTREEVVQYTRRDPPAPPAVMRLTAQDRGLEPLAAGAQAELPPLAQAAGGAGHAAGAGKNIHHAPTSASAGRSPGSQQPAALQQAPGGGPGPGQPASAPRPPGGLQGSPTARQNRANPARLGRLALLLAPVRAWLLVRAATNELAALRGHFTRAELTDYLVNGPGAAVLPHASVTREVDRALKNLDRHNLVPVGRRGREVVFTTRAQKKLELAAIRLADELSARLGRRVKARHRRLAAALVRDGGAEEAAAFLTDRSRLRLLDARPGDEQAALLNHVARAFERSGGRVRWLAPTALGAEDLRRRTGGDAMTAGAFLRRVSPLPVREVVRHLLGRPFRPIGRIAADAERLRRPLERLTRRDVVIVDLAHLLGTRDLHALLKAVRRSRAKLILVGDSEGLSSPVAGGGWQYLTTRLPVARVEPRGRPAQSPEAEAADLIRRGRPEAAVEALDGEGRITFAADPADAADRLIAAYRLGGGLQEPARHLVVGGSKADADHLNRRVQAERRAAGLLGVASARLGSGASVRRGDRVAFTRPSRSLGVRSGERGEVTFVNPLSATAWVRTDGGRSVAVPLRRFPHLDLAYAATAARSSGLDADRRYALVRGPAFVRGAVLAILERTRERVEVFTPLGRDALAATVARRGEKRLAVAHGREGRWPRTPPGLRQGPSPAALGLTEMPAMDPM